VKDLLLLHGALGDRRQLEPLQSELEGEFRCHLVEFEGHGRLPSQHPYSVARFVDNVRAYMEAQRLQRASVFGYSMGGYVALALAAESQAIESVATLGTKLAWTPEVAATEKKQLDAAKIRAKVPAFAALLEQRHGGAGGWELVLERTASLMTGLGARPVVDDALLSRITQPVLLMVGDLDVVVSAEETSGAAAVLAQGKSLVLHSTPHPFERVSPDKVADAVRSFFAGQL
jgi:pimeloyl-ACP methyl ester carboxylesterase